MKIIMLGSGASAGVPEIGCSCEVCASANPKNQRTRVSVFVEARGKRLLIDTAPDLRMQALHNKINYVDAILYTHDHADHISGIDDVRMFNVHLDASIPAYADPITLASLQDRFAYIFQPRPAQIWYRPSLTPVAIHPDPNQADVFREFEAAGIAIIPILQHHARVNTLGFRIGNFAYSTDVNVLPEASLAKLEGLDVWIVDCLRYTPSVTHARLETVLQWVARLKPKRTVLTHMAHQFEYETLRQELPEGIEPGYDGLTIELPDM